MTTYLQRNGDEIKVRVEYTFYNTVHGARDMWGAPLEPDVSAHVDIESVWHNGKEIDIDADEEAEIKRELMNDLDGISH